MANVTTYATTLGDAREAVLGLINERVGNQFTYTKIDTFINQCCRSIYGKTNRTLYRASKTTDIGTDEYEIPDAFDTGIGANVQRVQIDGEDIDQVEFLPVTLDESGQPDSWAMLGDTLQISPKPDAAYTMTVMYEKEYVPVSQSEDTFSVNDQAVDCAVLYASYMMKLMDEEYTAAGMIRKLYEDSYDRITALPTGLYSANVEFEYGRE